MHLGHLPGGAHLTYCTNIHAGESWDEVRQSLEEAGIGTGVYYPVPVHLQPAYSNHGNPPCPRAEAASAEMISIPVHPAVSDEDRATIAAALNEL